MKGKINAPAMQSVLSKSIWLLLFTLLFYSGCGKEKKPADILSKDEMVKAIARISLCEQKIYNLSLKPDSAQEVFSKVKSRIFKDIGIPDSVFKKSYDYYMDRPQELEEIYTALIDTLNLYEQRGIITPIAPIPRKNPR